MSVNTLIVGSLEALEQRCDDRDLFGDWRDVDVVVVPTAAAFQSLEGAALASAAPFATRGARVESLMIKDRASNAEEYFVRRLAEADVVVLSDGSSLHARSVWRASAVGDALKNATCLIAVGETASVLGATMIDPRGGAPTTGLALREGIVVTMVTSAAQLARTRALLGDGDQLAVLGANGALGYVGSTWRCYGDVELSRDEGARNV